MANKQDIQYLKDTFAEEEEMEAISPWQDTFRRWLKYRFPLFGFIFICFFILCGLLAPFITSYSYDGRIIVDRLHKPSSNHWFGTDDVGRDIFTRSAYRARISIIIGFTAVS